MRVFPIVLNVALGLGAAALMSWMLLPSRAAAIQQGQPGVGQPAQPPQTAVQRRQAVERLMNSIELRSKSLAAAGVTPAQVGDLVAAAAAYQAEHGTQLTAAQTAVDQARAQYSISSRAAETRPDIQGGASRIARSQIATAETTLNQARDAAFVAITASLPDNTRAALARLRATAGQVDMPVHFRIVDRSNMEWSRLRRALTSAAAHERLGQTPDSPVQSAITQALADPAVVSARLRVEQSETQVRTALAVAIQGIEP